MPITSSICSAASIECRLVMDRQTDIGHTSTLAIHWKLGIFEYSLVILHRYEHMWTLTTHSSF